MRRMDDGGFTRVQTEFDSYAGSYDDDLKRAIAVSGEAKDYFARGRVAWTSETAARLNIAVRNVLDFGCGLGSTCPLLEQAFAAERVIGTDNSRQSLRAAEQYKNDAIQFVHLDSLNLDAEIDLAYCSGVFHHIEPAERLESASRIYRALRPGGVFALWENNPLNPGTRWIMHQCVFDKNAKTLLPWTATRLLRAAGFHVLSLDFLFFFPHALHWLRALEPRLRKLLFGAQYQVFAKKPALAK